jgi:hypothetical protein
MAMSTHDNLREIQMNNGSERDSDVESDEVYSSDVDITRSDDESVPK